MAQAVGLGFRGRLTDAGTERMTTTAPERPRALYLSLEPLVQGSGSHTHVRVIANGLSATGLHTTLVAREIASGGRRSAFSRLALYFVLTLKALAVLAHSDIAYVRAHPAAAPFAFFAKLARKPVIHEINGLTDDIGVTYGLPGWMTAVLRRSQHWQYRRAAALVAVTPGLAAWAAKIVGDSSRVHVVPNGADGDVFRPDAPDGPLIAGPYAVFFGGLVAWHGIATMLAAARSDHWPEGVRLVFVGDGPGRKDVDAAAQANARVVAIGYLPRAAVAGVAARALAVLCPIESHGSRDIGGVAPLKLFEGMASGRPVVATDLPFQGDLVRDLQCGLVVSPAETSALAQAVATLAADRERADAMGRKGRAAIETRYDWRYRVQDVAGILRTSFAASNGPRGGA